MPDALFSEMARVIDGLFERVGQCIGGRVSAGGGFLQRALQVGGVTAAVMLPGRNPERELESRIDSGRDRMSPRDRSYRSPRPTLLETLL